MCLITACPNGTDKSTKAIEGFIKSGMACNTDGSGFIYKRKGQNIVGLHKGFREVDAILKAIKALKLKDEDELIIHHRIGTSGLKNDENMHPFYLSNDVDLLNTTKGALEGLAAMAHNGNFFRYANAQSTHSDTWHFVEDLMSTPELIDLIQNDHKKFERFFKEVLGTNKLAFLFPNRDMILLGNFEEEDGYFHSNVGYKRKICDVGGRRANHRGYYPSLAHKHDNETELSAIAQNPASAQYRFLNEKHEYDHTKKMWVPRKQLLLADNKGTPLIEGIINNTQKILDRIKTSQIRLSSKDIQVTEDNYNHFILVPHTNYISKASTVIPKGRAFTIEDYKKDALFNYITSFDSSKVMEAVRIEEFLPYCNLFVKKENVNEYYKALHNLVTITGKIGKQGFMFSDPSPTMLKKIQKKLGSNCHKDEFQFKEYGLFKTSHLQYFLDQHKVVNNEAIPKNNDLGTPDVKNIVGVLDEDNAIVPEDFSS